jgi:Carboxypeptidase regulatory-like domain/TonB dependent receptor
MFQRFVSFATIAGLIALSVTASLGQVEQGTVTGLVIDASNAAVVDAKVTLTNVDTQVSAITNTNQQGNYNFPFTAPGHYAITAEKQGFSAGRVTNITITVGQTATINVSLATGSVKQEISVEANAVQLDERSSSLGNVVSSQQVVQLPLNGRNPYALLTLAPGVVPNGNTGTGPIISGGRSNTSGVLFDGQETRNTSTNDIAYTPPLETVAEFKVIINNFSAEYGRSGGGILTAAGRSGTNELHGSFYEFFRNNVLNANGWTNNRNGLKINPVRHNEFGFAVGGPVYIPKVYSGKNRTFFFFNYERIPDRSPDNITATVPTAAMRGGDFSQATTSTGALIKIYDPLTTVPNPASPGSYVRTQFPNNQIPLSRINPISLNLLQYYPLPNLPGDTNNYAVSETRANTATKYYGRVDENIGNSNRLFFRYGITLNPANTPGYTGIAFPGEGTNCNEGNANSTPWVAAISDTVTFRPNVVGEFRVSYTRQINLCNPRSEGFDLTKLGLPAYIKNASTDPLFPEIDVTDFTGLGPQRASHYTDAENTPEAQAHLTWLKGAHTIKGGFDYLFLAFNIFRPDYPSGDFGFTRAFTQGPDPSVASTTAGYGLATLLLGAPTGGSFTVGPSLAASQKSYNIYLQDDWKVARNLTLNLGARWEYQSPYNERYNHLAYFNPSATDPITGLTGVLSFTTPNNRYQSIPNQNNVAPRVGLAWTFLNNTVMRAGYGLFYLPGSGGIGASPGDLGSGSEASTPVFLGQAPAAPNTPPVGASLANPFVSGLLAYPNTLIGNGINAVFPSWATPVNQQWNFNIQRTILSDLLIEASYLGSRGEHIWANANVDAVNPLYLSLGSQLNALVPNPFYGKITSGSLSPATVRQSALLSPYPQYTSITDIRDSIGDSIYHAAALRVDKRFGHGLLLQASYTFSKLIDNTPERFSGRSSIIDPYTLLTSRSVSDLNRTNVFVTNFVYQLPIGTGQRYVGTGIAGKILGNWQISGIWTMESGQPVVITGPNNTQLPGISAYALRLHNPNLTSGQSINEWFDTTAFAAAPLYSLGTDSRTEPNLDNPWLFNLDVGFSRYQPITERIKLQFRAEMFNSTNKVNFSAPQGSVTATNFGQITAAGAGRTVQLGLRLTY